MTKDDVFLVTADAMTTLNPIYVEHVEIMQFVPEGRTALVWRVRALFKGHMRYLTEDLHEHAEAVAVWLRASQIITSPNAAIWLEEEKKDE